MIMINENIAQFGILHEFLSADKSMVPYFSRHSWKQFIKSKPARFGFKLWVLVSSTGMPYNLHIHEGKPADQNEDSLGSRVAKRAIAVCEKPEDHVLFFDNFFSSYKLLKELGQMGFRATGTMRNDRIEYCPLVPINDMKKMKRGVHDHRSSAADKIEIVRWQDNSVVKVGSNAYGLLLLRKVKRWKKGQGHVNVNQPAVIAHYNNVMGRVDLMGRALSDYRPSIHGKKWY